MQIQNYEIKDMISILGPKFSYEELKKYYSNSYGGENYNFEKYLKQLFDMKIITEENKKYKINCTEYVSYLNIPENIRKIIKFFSENFTYKDYLMIDRLYYELFFKKYIYFDDKGDVYYWKSSKFIISNNHKVYFKIRKIIKTQILDLPIEKLISIKTLMNNKCYYMDKKNVDISDLKKFIFIDDKILFLSNK